MHDAVVVRIFERVEQLAHDPHDFGHREAFVFLEIAFELASVHELHCDEGGAVVLTEIVNGNDIGMIEASRGLGFALKTRHYIVRLDPFELVAAYGFQRDRALYARVECLVHDAHRAAPELAPDFVFAEFERGIAHGLLSTCLREIVICTCCRFPTPSSGSGAAPSYRVTPRPAGRTIRRALKWKSRRLPFFLRCSPARPARWFRRS